VTVSAGESIQDFVNSINSGANLDVWAAATDATHVVLSTRATGAPGAGGYISVSQTGTSLTEDATKALPGQNAAYTIDGTPGSSAKNSVDGTTGGPFIPGVTLTLSGVTTTSGPVTVNVTPPAPNADSITAAVKAFVDSYNSVLDQINTQITQKTSTTDPTQGLLFGDSDLTSLRDSMRQAVYTSIAGLTGITSLADIGVSTGAASGAATYSQDAVDGKLTIDTTALTNAIQSNPSGVKQMLQSWSQNFAGLVNSVAAPGGSLDARIQGDNTELSDISNQIDNLNAILANRQTALQTQFANLEAVLSQHQAQSNWLAGQIAQLP
jgi:flagellar hook-associated protein 2